MLIELKFDGSQYYSTLLDIVNVGFANEINMDFLLSYYSSLNIKMIMIYNILEFHIPKTYFGSLFVDPNTCCGF